MKAELPSSWAWAPLADLGNWYGGGTPSKANPGFWENGTIPWVSPKDMKVLKIRDAEDHITQEAVEQSATNLIPPGAVLVVTRSGILRHSLPVAVTEIEVTINQDLKALVPYPGIDANYVAYALRAFASKILSKAAKEGTTVQSVEFSQLCRIEIPLASANEQQRIVREIERQLSRLDAALDSLRRVQAHLEGYRNAVLKAACEGRLTPTEAELARHKGKDYETGEQLKRRILQNCLTPTVNLRPNNSSLPEGWSKISTSQALSWSSGKFLPKTNQKTGPFPIFGGNGIVGYHERFLVGGPAIVIGRVGANCGNVHLTTEPSWITDNAIYAVVDSKLINPQYLKLALSATNSNAVAKGSGQPFLSQKILNELELPLPPLDEQQRIANEFDRLISIVEGLNATIEANLNRATALRRSILTAAFQGQLRSQSDDDEPAAVLLEKIRKAREEHNRERPRRGRGIKPGVSTPGSGDGDARPKSRRDAGSSTAPSGLPDESGSSSLGLKPQALSPGPFRAVPEENERNGADFLSLSREEQIDAVWEALLGRGPLDKGDAVRIAAQSLRDQGRARFQRLRADGPLYEAILVAIKRGVREGSLDRPRRDTVRAILPDAREYSPEDWRLCLLESLDSTALPEEEALRAAAEWARENLGLEFTRLREDGVILRGLQAAMKEAARQGEIFRRSGTVLRRSQE